MPFVFSDRLLKLASSPFNSDSLLDLRNLGLAALGFSLLSSFGYVINDYRDMDLDRKDPTKRNRPLAAGTITPAFGLLIACGLFATAFGISWILNVQVMALFLLYLVFNILFYTYFGKRIILVDVFTIATGFVIRVLVGAYAIGIIGSPWIISVTFFIALFLGFSKRAFEAKTAPPEVLIGGSYSEGILQHFISISASLCIMSYAVYCILGKHSKAQLYLTVPFVVLGIFRYYVITHNPETEKKGNPSDVLLADRFLLLIIVAWVVVCAALILNFHIT